MAESTNRAGLIEEPADVHSQMIDRLEGSGRGRIGAHASRELRAALDAHRETGERAAALRATARHHWHERRCERDRGSRAYMVQPSLPRSLELAAQVRARAEALRNELQQELEVVAERARHERDAAPGLARSGPSTKHAP